MLPSQTMRGFNTDGSEYVTEGVPWVMYFYCRLRHARRLLALRFGYSAATAASTCRSSDAEAIYAWAYPGMRVEVHD